MPEDIQDLLEAWVEENVHAEGFVEVEDGNPRPAELAKAFVSEAEKAGYTRPMIEAEIGDLDAYMANAIDRATDVKVKRLVDKDD